MITIKQVEHVAKLAKLSLDEDEKVKFTDQLGKIISYVELLNEVNTENVEPMTQAVPKINVMREDEILIATGVREDVNKNWMILIPFKVLFFCL